MFINIGEKIKLRREEKNVSQNDFADYLGVTCKEVVKWENGELYPDFELVPVIANYFGVSADELLCMEMFDNEDKIREYTDGFYEKVAAGNIREAVDAAREGMMHFPDEFRLKVLLMYGLYLSCDRPAAVKHYSGELLSIGEDILAHCTDDPIRLEAKRLLCLHYYEDLNDTEKAREIAMSLPGRKICREDMLPIISEGDAKLTAIQENISSYTSLLASAITSYTECDSSLGAREKIEFCEIAKKLRKMIYPSGDIFEGAYVHMMLLRDLAVLYMSVDEREKALRADIERIAGELFEQIGLQTDVERYCANSWERGAVLETIDLPNTDRAWLMGRLEKGESMPNDEAKKYMIRSVRRNEVESDEYYFSVAEHGFGVLGCEQVVGPEGIYMNFQGDRPDVNNGSLPTCLFKVYDNQSFRCKLGGFRYDTDYELKVTYHQKKDENIDDLTIKANGTIVYKGGQFGEEAEEFNREMLPDGFVCAVYQLPKDVFINGCVEIEIFEEHAGVMISEFRIVKKK